MSRFSILYRLTIRKGRGSLLGFEPKIGAILYELKNCFIVCNQAFQSELSKFVTDLQQFSVLSFLCYEEVIAFVRHQDDSLGNPAF